NWGIRWQVRAFRPTTTNTRGGSRETDANALAVMPWKSSRVPVVTTVTPVANRPRTWRKRRGSTTAAAPFWVTPPILSRARGSGYSLPKAANPPPVNPSRTHARHLEVPRPPPRHKDERSPQTREAGEARARLRCRG